MLSIILFVALTGIAIPFFSNAFASIKKGLLATAGMYLLLMILMDVGVGFLNTIERSSHRVHTQAVKIDSLLLLNNKKVVNAKIKEALIIASEGRMTDRTVERLFEATHCLIDYAGKMAITDIELTCAPLTTRPFGYHVKPLTALQYEFHFFGKWIPQGYRALKEKVNSMKSQWKADMDKIIWESKYTNDCYEANIQYTQSSAEGLDYVCRQKAKAAYRKHLAKKGAK